MGFSTKRHIMSLLPVMASCLFFDTRMFYSIGAWLSTEIEEENTLVYIISLVKI